jgi:hypothetical protein
MISVRDLDLMTCRERTLHWMRPDAWNPDGARLRFKQPARAFRAMTDGRGHVSHIPLLVGRPCFGIITAFVRYKNAMRPVKGRGMLPASRCADCKLRQSCERLVKERIKAYAPLSTAHDEWLRAEGPSKFDTPDFERTHVGRLWKRVAEAAADATFTSSNDAAVMKYYERLDRDALERDRRRQAAKREQDRRKGKIDSDHLRDLEIAANNRVIDVVDAMTDTRAPRELRLLPIQSLEDMRDVWLGREVVRAERRKWKAPDIARWIEATRRRNDSATFAALCTRVHKDLARIARFERLTWNGAPLLKPFDPAQESWSQVWLELANLKLLQNPDLSDRLIPLEIADLMRAELQRRSPQTVQKI